MPTYKDLIKEVRNRTQDIENSEDIDAVLGAIKAIHKGAQVVIMYDKTSGLVRIYDTVLDLILTEGDRLDELGNSIYDLLREMIVVYYLTNQDYTVIGLCAPKN
jgi:hypothetical protein